MSNAHLTIAKPTAAILIGAGATMLATSVLLDSGMEHYRGGFRNRAMLTPLLTATLGVAINVRPALVADWIRGSAQDTTALSGAVGLGFRLFDVVRGPGRFSWNNLFYAAPVVLGRRLIIEAGETIHTENSYKLSVVRWQEIFEAAG